MGVKRRGVNTYLVRGGDTVFEYKVRSRSLYEIRQLRRKHQHKALVPAFVTWKLLCAGNAASRLQKTAVVINDQFKEKMESGKSTLLVGVDDFRRGVVFGGWARVATAGRRRRRGADSAFKFAEKAASVKAQRQMFNGLVSWRMLVRRSKYRRDVLGLEEEDVGNGAGGEKSSSAKSGDRRTEDDYVLAPGMRSGDHVDRVELVQKSKKGTIVEEQPPQDQHYHNIHARVLAQRVRSLHKNVFGLDRPNASRQLVLVLFEKLERHFEKLDTAFFGTHFFDAWRVFACSEKTRRLQELNAKTEQQHQLTQSERDAMEAELRKARTVLVGFQSSLQERIGALSGEYEKKYADMQGEYERVLEDARVWHQKADAERRSAITNLHAAEGALQTTRDESRYLKARVAMLEQELAEVGGQIIPDSWDTFFVLLEGVGWGGRIV